jgi:hypothetical protein
LSYLSRWGVTEEHTASWLRVAVGGRGLAARVSEIPLREYTSCIVLLLWGFAVVR